MTCANCGRGIGSVDELPDVCALEVLLSVLLDREDFDEADVRRLWASVDADEFWDQLGPVVDWLEAQLDTEEA